MNNNKIYIALLRGINVGGHKKVPMAILRELLTNAGLDDVKTYIQSGNVVFQSIELNTSVLEDLISSTIKNYFQFEVPVLVRTRTDLKTIFDNCPFPEEKKLNSYFTMLSEIPNREFVDEFSEKTNPNEVFQIIKDCIYFFSAKGYGNAKFNLNFFEKKLKVNATSRNYKTMVKLLSLSDI
ncbi:DUF1697 domain-containing protein [Winogradskyella sp. UBA3174]|uniref:DUF1697 domain-containing protein n=1 Tax=Winogradskyella sp. UBA3174 TaxID=1947785 RepID=UPI0025E84DEF|nr:DUF1697 domain-containing protein [Winogradskyella sp. UBA3174]|tara:strand:- start:40327 stop:40869 length:543 start_codon:yes stop_codon:yes gene_type:complete